MYSSLLVPLALFGLAAPAAAAAYRATPLVQPDRAVVVTRDNVWRCDADGCAATGRSSRPAVACARLARELGALRAFSVDGRDFTGAELARCNGPAGQARRG